MSCDPTRPADRIVFWLCACVAITIIYGEVYQYGYDAGRTHCRPPVKMDIQKMSAKAQARWVKYLAARQS